MVIHLLHSSIFGHPQFFIQDTPILVGDLSDSAYWKDEYYFKEFKNSNNVRWTMFPSSRLTLIYFTKRSLPFIHCSLDIYDTHASVCYHTGKCPWNRYDYWSAPATYTVCIRQSGHRSFCFCHDVCWVCGCVCLHGKTKTPNRNDLKLRTVVVMFSLSIWFWVKKVKDPRHRVRYRAYLRNPTVKKKKKGLFAIQHNRNAKRQQLYIQHHRIIATNWQKRNPRSRACYSAR